jgi:hypothetical protein
MAGAATEPGEASGPVGAEARPVDTAASAVLKA